MATAHRGGRFSSLPDLNEHRPIINMLARGLLLPGFHGDHLADDVFEAVEVGVGTWHGGGRYSAIGAVNVR